MAGVEIVLNMKERMEEMQGNWEPSHRTKAVRKAFAYRRASRPLWSLTSACSVELAVKQLALDEFEEPVHFDL